MKKPALVLLVLVLVVAGIGVAVWRARESSARPGPAGAMPETKSDAAARRTLPVRPRPKLPPAGSLSAAEKATLVDQIKRDYDEIRAKAAADYAAAGTAFPGGLSAFLRQLALLEREKRADFATVLSPRELEDLELRESTAGQLVQRFLGDTVASEEQRRAVFRLQRNFDDKFALTFDVSPPILFQRESERQATQRAISQALGNEELFGAWLRGEGSDYTTFRGFVAQQGLPVNAAIELWAAKNDFTLRRLELAAQPQLSADQIRSAQAALVQESLSRVLGILGPAGLQAAGPDVLGWLPRGK